LSGKSYVVVGGSGGIGLASAEALAAQGARVAIVGRNVERAKAAAASLSSTYGVKTCPVVGDTSVSQDEVDRFIAEAISAVGPVSGMAVTTGTDGQNSRRPLEAMTDDNWIAAYQDLVLGTIRPCKAIIPHLVEQRSGAIVTTAAYSVRAPDPTAVPYSTLKAAVAVYTKGLARAYGKQGIQVNCICPGATETAASHDLRGRFAKERGLPYEEALERVLIDDYGMDIAMKRLAQPREVGELVAYLLSGRSGYLTGALVNIDGGTNF
jgi:NAD(P)-dependent dehydrogenase (short-subunit alcohol dehydrogenase family)